MYRVDQGVVGPLGHVDRYTVSLCEILDGVAEHLLVGVGAGGMGDGQDDVVPRFQAAVRVRCPQV